MELNGEIMQLKPKIWHKHKAILCVGTSVCCCAVAVCQKLQNFKKQFNVSDIFIVHIKPVPFRFNLQKRLESFTFMPTSL